MGQTSIPPLALTMGDPAGCGPQITASAWRALKENPTHVFAAIGPSHVFAPFAPIRPIATLAEAEAVFASALPVFEAGLDCPAISAGQADTAAAPAIIGAIETGTELVQLGDASALVTNPIHKALLYDQGFRFPGHTEFLANLVKRTSPAPHPVMMLVGGGLRVALATIHVPLANVPTLLTTERILQVGRITHAALVQDFGINKPKIALTGLNPHAGEDGSIGREEIEIINPAAAQLRSDGINCLDARSADTIFAEMLGGAFDAIIAMTHDQGLIPVKTLDFWGGVNVTLGLPIVRTSPDHGTAYDAAAAGTCRADSLIAAIRLAGQNAAMRATPK